MQYTVGATYRDTGGIKNQKDQFLRWVNIPGSGMLNSPGIRGLKYTSDLLQHGLPAYVILVTHEVNKTHHNPWPDKIDLQKNQISYWGDAKRHRTKTLNDFTGNKLLLNISNYIDKGCVQLIPPILHFSKEKIGYVKFNGLCVLSNLTADSFKYRKDSVQNYLLNLTILETQTVSLSWLHSRVKSSSTEDLDKDQNVPVEWQRYLSKKFGKLGLTIGDPDEIVALGTAIYSGINSKEDLNESQKENLDSIHPANEIFKHSEPTQFDEWEIYYGALIKYKHIYKNVLIPYSFKTSDGIRLGKWCADQREEYNSGNLSEFHIGQLNELGFDWVINLATTSRSNETSSQYLGIACFMTDKHTGRTELRHRWIIDKGTELPCTVGEYLYTHVDNQKVIPIQVMECNEPEDEMEYVKIIWEGELNLPPGVKAGDEIELIFEKMEDQRLNCKFVYMKTGTTEAVSLKGQREIMEQDKNTIEKFTLE
tara:strand:- start:58 stop:1497 length:1440 start_codon:yes stop_codon:yes gene_type:complete